MLALPKSVVIPVTVIVLAIIGALTVLAWHGTVTGSDVIQVVTLILGGVVGLTGAHIGGQVANSSGPPPAPAGSPDVSAAAGIATPGAGGPLH